jgi:PAS domain S-box-containing protein
LTNPATPAPPLQGLDQLAPLESVETLREMMDSIPQLVFQANREGILTYANLAWFEYTGLSPSVLDAAAWHEVVHSRDIEKSLERWSASTASGDGYEVEARLRRHDGAHRWHVVRAAPARNAFGDGVAWYGTATDIDDLRRVQRTLRHSEERLRLAQRVAGMGTWEWDIERDTVTWSPELEELYGVAETGFAGGFETILEHVHPDDRERMRESVEGLLATGSHAIEHRIVLPNGEVRWVASRGEVFSDPEGRPLRAIGVGLDITGRKRDEEALRAVDQRHKVLADAGAALPGAATPDSIAEAAVRCVVPALADACTVELLDGGELRTAASIAADDMPGRACAPGAEGAVRALETAQSLFVEETAPNAPSVMRGRIEHLNRTLGVMSLCRESGARQFDVADRLTIRELAARVGARLNEQRVNSTKDEVLALVSHELRTPLTILKGNANTLRRHGDQIDPAARAEALKDIEADADRLEQIVRNMLVLAQNDSARPGSGTEPLILSRVVEATVRDHLDRHPAPPITLQLQGDRVMVLGHEAHLRQVVANLLSNGAKYGGESPIDVVIFSEGENGIVEVSDRGPGLPPGALRRVFEPFYRSSANAGKAPGVGLGLTVCRRLIAAQGGTIRAAARPGGGTSFFVSLPLFEPDAAEA